MRGEAKLTDYVDVAVAGAAGPERRRCAALHVPGAPLAVTRWGGEAALTHVPTGMRLLTFGPRVHAVAIRDAAAAEPFGWDALDELEFGARVTDPRSRLCRLLVAWAARVAERTVTGEGARYTRSMMVAEEEGGR